MGSSPELRPKHSPLQTPAIHSNHTPSFLLAQHSYLFSYWQNQSFSSEVDLLSDIHPIGNPIVFHSFNMAKPLENTFINYLSTPFVTPHNYLNRAFDTLSILQIPSKPLRLSIYTALILDLSFNLYINVSLPYDRTGTSNPLCSPLAHSSCIPLALTKELITPASFLPLVTFLRHSAISVPDSPKIFEP